jgi:hypothetical protein
MLMLNAIGGHQQGTCQNRLRNIQQEFEWLTLIPVDMAYAG